MPTIRLLASLAFAALSVASPAMAGHVNVGQAPNNGRMAPAEACPYDTARAALKNADMTYLADVPRTKTAYRFVVKWKGEVDGASVSAFNCEIDIAFKAALRQPWCAYVPGDKLQCPLTTAQ